MHDRAERTRGDSVRAQPRGDARSTLGNERELSPLARLLYVLGEAKIDFQVARMTAALLQGVPVTTLDADLWINLPERRYGRVLDICQKLGATILAKTVVALKGRYAGQLSLSDRRPGKF